VALPSGRDVNVTAGTEFRRTHRTVRFIARQEGGGFSSRFT